MGLNKLHCFYNPYFSTGYTERNSRTVPRVPLRFARASTLQPLRGKKSSCLIAKIPSKAK